MDSSRMNKETFTFSLRGLSIRNFLLIEPGLDITNEFDVNKLKVGFNLDFNHNFESNSFHVLLGIVYHYQTNDEDITLLECTLIFDFSLSNINSVIEIKNNKFKIPPDLLSNFVSISFSTARGIIFSKTQGSFLNNFILPLIDPKVLIEPKIKEINETD